jgi:6-phosphogluconolactonase (cycloisomerase 2 family)
MRPPPLAHSFFALLLTLVLAACGGDSNNSSNNPSGNNGANNPGNSGGGSSTAAEYLYAVNPAANDQSTFIVYRIDSTTGALTQVSSATIPVRAASFIRADSTGQNAFVAGFEAPGTNLDLVKVNPGAAQITPLPGQTFHSSDNLGEGDCCPSALAVSADGKFAYVGGLNDGSIHVYSVDPASGSWNELKNNYRQQIGRVYEIALNDGLVYEAQRYETGIAGWSRDATSGLLSPLPSSPFETGALASSADFGGDGKWLLVPHYETGNLDVFSVAAGGALSRASSAQSGSAAQFAATDPQNRFVFVVNPSQNATVSAFKLGSDGALTAAPGSPYSTIQGGGEPRVDPSGKFLYIVGSFGIGVFGIDQSTGALSPISGSPFPGAVDGWAVKM